MFDSRKWKYFNWNNETTKSKWDTVAISEDKWCIFSIKNLINKLNLLANSTNQLN